LEKRHNDGDITLSTKSLMDKAETKNEELRARSSSTTTIAGATRRARVKSWL
jgi:hypothetical protein